MAAKRIKNVSSNSNIKKCAIWVEGRTKSYLCNAYDVQSSGALVIIDPSVCPSDRAFLRLGDAGGYILCSIVWRGDGEIGVVFLSRHEKVEFGSLAC